MRRANPYIHIPVKPPQKVQSGGIFRSGREVIMEMDVLDEMIGQNLNAVTFIHDYLQLQFERVTVSLFAYPEVTRNSSLARIEDADYRNKLCEFIGKTVTKVEIEGDSDVAIAFGLDRLKLQHLDDSPEDAIFTLENGVTVAV